MAYRKLLVPLNGTDRDSQVLTAAFDIAKPAQFAARVKARALELAGRDVYLNVAGGLKVSEPAADLAVAAALVSSVTGTPMPAETVAFGEIGLGGEVRAVSQADARLKEAAKLGFSRALVPRRRKEGPRPDGIQLREIARLADLVGLFDADQQAPRRGGSRP